MGRDFLFADTQEHAALARLLQVAASATGFLAGSPGEPPPGWYVPGADNRAFLTDLLGALEAGFPHAGRPFHAVRLWTNLMWQPAYLAVVAVHVHGAVPDLDTLSQQRRGVDVSGFRLPVGAQFKGEQNAMIERAGTALRAYGDEVLGGINAVTRLKKRPAQRLLADRMLGIMLRLPHYLDSVDLAEQLRLTAIWLEALGLTGQGDLEVITLPDGGRVPISARKGCCLDYLAFPGTYCSSCPKQDDDVRRARQRQDAIAEWASV